MAMSPRLRHLLRPTHDQLLSAVQEVLVGEKWDVDREPIVGTARHGPGACGSLPGAVRPDIVAREPDGATYVIEVKQGEWEANLGAVAQVETFRNVVAREFGGEPKGLLVIAGEAPKELRAVARSADVELVCAASAAIGSVRESLTRSGVVSESEIVPGRPARR